MRRFLLIALACGLALAGAAALAAYFYNRPTLLKIAVARDTEDHKLVFAMAHALSNARRSVRLRIAPVEGAAAAAAALDSGEVDLAVARSDVALPASGQTLVILHRNAVLLIVPPDKQIASVADLAGKRVGYMKGPYTGDANARLLDTILAQYDAPKDSVEKVALNRREAPEALRAGRVDALMAVGPIASEALADLVATIGQGRASHVQFLPVAEAKAIAQRLPIFEPIEVLRGAFGGNPPRPAASFETLGVSIRLMARESLKNSLAADLARALFSERSAIAKLAPLANLIEAPSTDKDAALPVHAGAAAYYDNEEENFFEKYSDIIYIGAMLLSVLGSAGAALASRMTAASHSELDLLLERLLNVLRKARAAATLEELETMERETDEILVAGMANRAIIGVDSHGMAALSLALDQARHALRERRAHLAGSHAPAAPRPLTSLREPR